MVCTKYSFLMEHAYSTPLRNSLQNWCDHVPFLGISLWNVFGLRISWSKFLKLLYINSLGPVLENVVLKTDRTNLWQTDSPVKYHYVKSVCFPSFSGPHSIQMPENADQKNSENGNILRSAFVCIEKATRKYETNAIYTSRALSKLTKKYWSDWEGGWYNTRSNQLHFRQLISINSTSI